MKKYILNTLAMGVLALGLGACFENPSIVYDGNTLVEFDAAVNNAPAAGRTFPLISTTNGAGQLTPRINLVGPQRATESQIKVSVDPANTTAVEGTHFRILNNGSVGIPAQSSFGNVTLEILRAPAQVAGTVTLVLLLEGNGTDILPSENFKRIGYTIRL